MKKIQKSALIAYAPEQMFALVDDVDRYAEFLPWCGDSKVTARQHNVIEATLMIKYGTVNQSFSTRNLNSPHSRIEMQLLNGPFRTLRGDWQFVALGNAGTKIILQLEFEFTSKILDLTVGPIFSQIANSLVDAFVQRAKHMYG